MNRLRLIDFREDDAVTTIGICQGDIASAAQVVNQAQERLVYAKEAGDTGWWGSWARTVFNVSRTGPFITLPREIARFIAMDVCNRPVSIENEFYEFLEFGNGLQPGRNCCTSLNGNNCQQLKTYDRGTVPTFVDLTPPGKTVQVVMTNAADAGQRVLIQGQDKNGDTIITEDGINQVQGIYVVLAFPFVQAPLEISKITGIQKDVTIGPVKIYEVDLATAATTLLLTMEPSEKVASYRRYFVNGLPLNCCNTFPLPTTVQITGMAKLELVPVKVDTDYLLIQSIQALAEECQSIRFSKMDSLTGAQQAKLHHQDAIGLLNGQLTHYLGVSRPAVQEHPFGSARLRRQAIGSMT